MSDMEGGVEKTDPVVDDRKAGEAVEGHVVSHAETKDGSVKVHVQKGKLAREYEVMKPIGEMFSLVLSLPFPSLPDNVSCLLEPVS